MADKLATLDLKGQTGVLKSGMSAATEPVVQAAKQNIQNVDAVDTGALKRSMSKRVRSYRDGDLIMGFVGPDVRYYEGGKRIKREKGETRADYAERNAGKRKPSKYAHLIEFGFYSAHSTDIPFFVGTKRTRRKRKRNFPERSFFLPRPFLRPAMDSNQGTMTKTLGKATGEAITKEFSKVR